jgi:hypothetical protein
MKNVELTKADLRKIFNASNQEGKQFLQDKYGEDFLKFDWKDIDSVEAAMNYNGTTIDEILPYKNPTTPLQHWHNDLALMNQVCQAINQGWSPDWSDSDQRKWRPWFEFNASSSGFRFLGSHCDLVYTASTGGSRLMLETEEKSDYCAKQFIELWNKILLNKN